VLGRKRAALHIFDQAMLPSGAKEHEPHHAENQYRKAGGDEEERKHRRPGLGLPRFGRRFDDLAVLSRCHADLDFPDVKYRRSFSGATYRRQRVILDDVPDVGAAMQGRVTSDQDAAVSAAAFSPARCPAGAALPRPATNGLRHG
jgi:hypothetical protein